MMVVVAITEHVLFMHSFSSFWTAVTLACMVSPERNELLLGTRHCNRKKNQSINFILLQCDFHWLWKSESHFLPKPVANDQAACLVL